MKQHVTYSQLKELDWDSIVDISGAIDFSFVELSIAGCNCFDDCVKIISKQLTIDKMIELLTIDNYYFCLSYANDDWIAERENDLGTLSAVADEPCDALWELLKLDLEEWKATRE